MADIIISGEVVAKRISGLTAKLAAEILSLDDWSIAIDKSDEASSFQASLKTLQILLGGIYRPAVEPVLVGSVLTLDVANNTQAMFEPRKASATRTIDGNYTLVLSNSVNANLISKVVSLTGTIIITMPADVLVSNPSTLGVWDDTLKTLTMSAGTDDLIEFQFLWDKTNSQWFLKVSEVAL